MTIIPAPPNDVNQCRIFEILHEKSDEYDGIAAQVQKFLGQATHMLDLVMAGPFRQYTLHNQDHAKKIIHLYNYLIPRETLTNLSSLECLLLIYSAYLHDMGMAITSIERDRIIRSDEFQDSLRDWPELLNALKQDREHLVTCDDTERLAFESIIYQLQEAGLRSFLRPIHATRDRCKEIIDQIKEGANDPGLFCYKDVSFEEYLIDICVSHNQECTVLNETKTAYDDKFPRDLVIAHEKVNMQFCAAMLRLADILDFDRERTPRILFESIGIPSSELPGAEVSLEEWEKHMSIHNIEIKDDEIVVSADCKHPAIEKAIRDFCLCIERELRDTTAILKRNSPSVLQQYNIELPLNVRPRIRSIGYTYKDLSLRLNQSAIISLLMGEKLYSHPGVALRELIQNSLDACDIRKKIETNCNYLPSIVVTNSTDNFGKHWIEVIDNGIGMDEHVLSEYFLKLGDSYYSSSEFTSHFTKIQNAEGRFIPISRFGIGILSAFLLADVLEIKTRSIFSPRKDYQARFLRIERLGGLVFISELQDNIQGTTIRLRLRSDICLNYDEFAKNEITYLKWLLLRPWYMINLSFGQEALSSTVPTKTGDYYSVSSEGMQSLIQLGLEPIIIDFERWSNKLTGKAILLFAKNSTDQLSTSINGCQIYFSESAQNGIKPSILISNFKGNRLTINGFQVKNFRSKGLMRFKNIRIPIIFDIDAIGDQDVEFDVSRERLTVKGEAYLKKEIRASISYAINETGAFDRMEPELKSILANVPLDISEFSKLLRRPDAIKNIYDSVLSELPGTRWPTGLHRQIADKLGLSPSLVSKIISDLLKSGSISKPC